MACLPFYSVRNGSQLRDSVGLTPSFPPCVRWLLPNGTDRLNDYTISRRLPNGLSKNFKGGGFDDAWVRSANLLVLGHVVSCLNRGRLLITGASGFLGWNLCQMAQSKWRVYGTSFSKSVTIPGVQVFATDLRNFEEVRRLFVDVQPTAVIHTAAQANANTCQLHPKEAYAINVIASCNIAILCADANIPCVFTSTDLVFDGSQPPYQETDPVNPLSRYGEQKVMAEEGMLERYPGTTICRMPLMFGYATYGSSFIQPFIQTLREGRPLRLFTDEFRTPVSGLTAAKGILLALEKVRGRIHLGGKERISRYDFALLMAKILNLPVTALKPCLQADVPMAAPRPADVSLTSNLAFSLGYNPPSLQEELMALRAKV